MDDLTSSRESSVRLLTNSLLDYSFRGTQKADRSTLLDKTASEFGNPNVRTTARKITTSEQLCEAQFPIVPKADVVEQAFGSADGVENELLKSKRSSNDIHVNIAGTLLLSNRGEGEENIIEDK